MAGRWALEAALGACCVRACRVHAGPCIVGQELLCSKDRATLGIEAGAAGARRRRSLRRAERARAVTTVFGGLDVGSAVSWCGRCWHLLQRPLPKTWPALHLFMPLSHSAQSAGARALCKCLAPAWLAVVQVGLLLCGPLIHWFGWQSVFYLFAVLGFVWCLLWPLCRPEQRDADMPFR